MENSEENRRIITLALRQEEARKSTGVLITIYRNGSGYLWSMSKDDSGTDLGWSEYDGNCEHSGAFHSNMDALEHALDLVEQCPLPQFKKEFGKNFHWGLYSKHIKEKYGNDTKKR